MKVTLIGMGCGAQMGMTCLAQRTVETADCLLGAARLLESVPQRARQQRIAAIHPEKILQSLLEEKPERPCVLYSGDTGFYSGTRSLLPLLRQHNIEYEVLPGISSVQMLSARIGQPWQDWSLYSAHGTDCDAVQAVSHGRQAFFLTGGTLGPADLCRQLVMAGLGDLQVIVAENLSYDNERIVRTTAAEGAEMAFAALSVMLAQPAPMPIPKRSMGLDDGCFVRGNVPMTKQEVRAAVLGKLAVQPTDLLWDVGAGTGSVSVELALAADRGRVYAIECEADACELIWKNRARCGAWNLTLVQGRAPEALADLPAPDAVFVGGTKGSLAPILARVFEANPAARVCISAIALETLSSAVAALTALGKTAEVTQIAVSRTRTAGGLHLLLANNPIFLITARGVEETA